MKTLDAGRLKAVKSIKFTLLFFFLFFTSILITYTLHSVNDIFIGKVKRPKPCGFLVSGFPKGFKCINEWPIYCFELTVKWVKKVSFLE